MCHHRARVRARVPGPGSRSRLCLGAGALNAAIEEEATSSELSAAAPEQQALLQGDEEGDDAEVRHDVGGGVAGYTTSYSPVVHQCFCLFALLNLVAFGFVLTFATQEILWTPRLPPPLDRALLLNVANVYDDVDIKTHHSRWTYFFYWLRSILMVSVLDYNLQPLAEISFWERHICAWCLVLVFLSLKAALLLLLFFWSGMTDVCTSCGCVWGHGKCILSQQEIALSDEEEEDGVGIGGKNRSPLPRGLADSRGPSSVLEHEKPEESTKTGKSESGKNTSAVPRTFSGDGGEQLVFSNMSAGSQNSYPSRTPEAEGQNSRGSSSRGQLVGQLRNNSVLRDLRAKLPRNHGPNVNRARILSTLLLVVCGASLVDHIALGVLYEPPSKNELPGAVAGESGVKYHLPFMWLDATVMFLTFVFLATTRWDRDGDGIGEDRQEGQTSRELASLSDEFNIRPELRPMLSLEAGDDERDPPLVERGSAAEAVLVSGTVTRTLTDERRGRQADYDVNAETSARAEHMDHMASKTERKPAGRGCVRVVLADIFCAGNCTSVYCVVGLMFLSVVAIPLFFTLFVFEENIDDPTKIQQLLTNFDRDTCRPARYYEYNTTIEKATDKDGKTIELLVPSATELPKKKKGLGARAKAQPAAFIALRENAPSRPEELPDAKNKTKDYAVRKEVASAKNQRHFYRVADTALPYRLVPKVDPETGRAWDLTPKEEGDFEEAMKTRGDGSLSQKIDYNETERFVAVPNDGRLSPILWVWWQNPSGRKTPPFVSRCMLAWRRVIHAENRRLEKEIMKKSNGANCFTAPTNRREGCEEVPPTKAEDEMKRFPWRMVVVNATNARELIPRGVLDSINIYFKTASAMTGPAGKSPTAGPTISARYSDLVRLALLQRYGGLYVDATTVPTRKDLSWLAEKFRVRERHEAVETPEATEAKDHENKHKNRAGTTEIFAFSRVDRGRDPSEDGEFAEMPVLESWFIAAAPKSQFMCLWLMELEEMLALGHKAQRRKLTSIHSPLAKELPGGEMWDFRYLSKEKEGGTDRGFLLRDQAYFSVYLAEDYVVQNYARFPDTAYRSDPKHGRPAEYLRQRLNVTGGKKVSKQHQNQRQGDPMSFFRINHTSSWDQQHVLPLKLYDSDEEMQKLNDDEKEKKKFLRSSRDLVTGELAPLPNFVMKFVDSGKRICPFPLVSVSACRLLQMEKDSFAQRTLFPEGLPTPEDLARELNGTEGFSADEKAPPASDESVFVQ